VIFCAVQHLIQRSSAAEFLPRRITPNNTQNNAEPKNMNNDRTLEISWGTILRVSVAIFCFYLILLVRDILVYSVFGLIIAILFETPIRFLEKKLPRGLAVVFVYTLTFSLTALLVYLPASRLVAETRQFIGLFRTYFDQIAPPLRTLGIEAFENMESFINAFGQLIQAMTSNIFSTLFSIFGGIGSTVFVLSIAIFLSMEGKGIEKNLVLLFSKKDEEYILSLWRKCQKRVGLWFLTSLISCLAVGILSWVTFYFLKVRYIFALSVVAGALNFVPVLGPIFAALFIFVILALDSWTKAFFALVCFVIIQQIENNIITPYISKKFVGLSPALILISLTIGGKLFGLWGAVLTVPLMGVIVEFSKGLLEMRRESEAGAV
jgi:predicted PurR-regulated permease PerM